LQSTIAHEESDKCSVIWTIPNYSKIPERFYSPNYETDGHPWFVNLDNPLSPPALLDSEAKRETRKKKTREPPPLTAKTTNTIAMTMTITMTMIDVG